MLENYKLPGNGQILAELGEWNITLKRSTNLWEPPQCSLILPSQSMWSTGVPMSIEPSSASCSVWEEAILIGTDFLSNFGLMEDCQTVDSLPDFTCPTRVQHEVHHNRTTPGPITCRPWLHMDPFKQKQSRIQAMDAKLMSRIMGEMKRQSQKLNF
jgi:hypothetical protein